MTKIIVPLLIIVAGIAYFLWKPSETSTTCFIYNTEAGDSATLTFATKSGNKIEGAFDLALYEKDRKSGAFEGTLSGDVAEVIWSASAEGETHPEELKIRFLDTIAEPAFGEMVLSDGTYVYAHPEALTYPIRLQSALCEE